MEHFTRLVSLLLFLLTHAALPVTALAGQAVAAPREYNAVYEVLRGGENVAKVTISLTRQQDGLAMRGFTHDMQGLAKLLNVKGKQSVRGTWTQGHFQPEQYEFLFSLIGYKSAWQADYDWPAGIVTTHRKSDQHRLSLTSGATDPLSLFLNTRAHLAAGQAQMEIDVIDEDEIKQQLYLTEQEELLETKLGCFATTRVKRVRNNDKRNSLAWYANDYDYLPVMLLHEKKKGKDLSMKLISLVFDGQQVSAANSCVADM